MDSQNVNRAFPLAIGIVAGIFEPILQFQITFFLENAGWGYHTVKVIFFSLKPLNCFGFSKILKEDNDSVHQSVSYNAVCRASLAAPSLLNIQN